MTSPDSAFARFRDKRILVTGHTGFKGSWLVAWLYKLGAQVFGVSLDAPTIPSHFEAGGFSDLIADYRIDIRQADELNVVVAQVQPDYVFHLAAQSLVRQSYVDPSGTYQTNVLGTLHLLEALRGLSEPCVAVFITSDKCYDNSEWVWGYRETDELGGPDPYSASKGAAELVIRSHLRSFFPTNTVVRIGVARAGNVIGGGDWATDRVVPDCIRCWVEGKPVRLRNPRATRPWQHVLEPLSGYLSLAAALGDNPELHGEPFNFGPLAHHDCSVQELVTAMSNYWPGVSWEDGGTDPSDFHESGLLKLNCDKALHLLRWRSTMSLADTVRMTAQWYRSYYGDSSTIRDVTFAQIDEYEAFAHEEGLHWTLSDYEIS